MSINIIREAKDHAWDRCREDREPFVGPNVWTVGDVFTYRDFFNLGYEAALSIIDPDAISLKINKAVDEISKLTGEDFHGYRSEIYRVLSALAGATSTAHDDAIRRECADRLCDHCPVLKDYTLSKCSREPSQCSYRAAILAIKPAREEL